LVYKKKNGGGLIVDGAILSVVGGVTGYKGVSTLGATMFAVGVTQSVLKKGKGGFK
jgi:hypothetical protein